MPVEPTSGRAQRGADLARLCRDATQGAPWPMVAVGGTSHLVRYVNSAFSRLVGKPAQELVGTSFCELLPESQECVSFLERVIRTGFPESHTSPHSTTEPNLFRCFTMWPLFRDQQPVGVMVQVTEGGQFHDQTVAINQALLVGALRQH